MFLSAKSFADLKDKSLICEHNEVLGNVILYQFGHSSNQDVVTVKIMKRKNEHISIDSIHRGTYTSDSSTIKVDGFDVSINRKTLIITENKKTGKCKAFTSDDALKKMQIYMKEEKRKYNKLKEGNKI
jgi:hypothetical protein